MKVSIVIPCFNYAAYLREAIDSALGQAWPDIEVIVVDDGSTDRSAAVAESYPQVQLVRQPNRGLGSARNAGVCASRGAVLIFLDADDRLRPCAAPAAVHALESQPDAMMVFGRAQLIDACGKALPTNHASVTTGFYEELLRHNYIWMPAMAAYRRAAFRRVGLFDTTRSASADYDMYLRVTRQFPVVAHDTIVADYRQHETNMSRDPVLMLDAALAAIQRQRFFVCGSAQRRAYREGTRQWRAFYGERLVERFRAAYRVNAAGSDALRCGAQLLRLYPGGVVYHALRKLMNLTNRWHESHTGRESRSGV